MLKENKKTKRLGMPTANQPIHSNRTSTFANAPGAACFIFLPIFTVIFCQTFYIPLQAHMRKVVPMELVGRASILLSLVGVAAIPLMQTGFGAILDLTRAAGFETADQFRFSFGAMAALMFACAAVYSFARQADDE